MKDEDVADMFENLPQDGARENFATRLPRFFASKDAYEDIFSAAIRDAM